MRWFDTLQYLLLVPCYAREIYTFDIEIQNYRRSLLCPCAPYPNFIFKFSNRRLVQFELHPLRVGFA